MKAARAVFPQSGHRILALNLGEILREFEEILGGISMGSKR